MGHRVAFLPGIVPGSAGEGRRIDLTVALQVRRRDGENGRAFGQQPFPQQLVPRLLFRLGEMHGPVLLGAVGIVQPSIPELLAGQVEDAALHLVEAVEAAVPQGHAVHLPAVDVLHQKSRDGALAQGFVLRRPVLPHPGRAGLLTPDPGQLVIVCTGRQPKLVPDIGCFPAVKMIRLHFSFSSIFVV